MDLCSYILILILKKYTICVKERDPVLFRVTEPQQSLPVNMQENSSELTPAECQFCPPGDVCYKQKGNEIVHLEEPVISGGCLCEWKPF